MTQPGGIPAVPAGGNTSTADRKSNDESTTLSGAARTCGFIAAGLALAIYLLLFSGDVTAITRNDVLLWVLIVGGGLLAGAAGLPRSGRLLIPAAVATLTGALLLLEVVLTSSAVQTLAVIATVLAFLLAGVAIIAALFATGLIAPPQSRPRGYGAPAGYGNYGPPPPGYGYGQQPGYPPAGGYGSPYGQPPGYAAAAPHQPAAYGPADPTANYPTQFPYSQPASASARTDPGSAAPSAPPAAGSPAAGTQTASVPTTGDWFASPDIPPRTPSGSVPAAGAATSGPVPTGQAGGAAAPNATQAPEPGGPAHRAPADVGGGGQDGRGDATGAPTGSGGGSATSAAPSAASAAADSDDDSDDEKTQFIAPSDRPSNPA